MLCVKCGIETGLNYDALCKACFDKAMASYEDFKRLFKDNNLARDAEEVLKNYEEEGDDDN